MKLRKDLNENRRFIEQKSTRNRGKKINSTDTSQQSSPHHQKGMSKSNLVIIFLLLSLLLLSLFPNISSLLKKALLIFLKKITFLIELGV